MSTRCQVKVIQSGIAWEQAITLYHHCDGYPSNILPLIHKAYLLSGGGWESGRAAKAASYLCAVDPGQFEPEQGHELHGDIEYYYIVDCRNSSRGSVAEQTTWNVAVYTPREGFYKIDIPTEADMKCIYKALSAKAAKEADKVVE